MADDVNLKFTGDGTSVFATLEEIGKKTTALGTTFSAVQEGIQEDLKESGEAAKVFGKNIGEVSQLIVAVSKSGAGGLPILAKNLKDVADLTGKIKSGLSATDKTNLAQINTALREVAKNENVVIRALGEEKKARIATLVETQKITAEEARLLEEVQSVVDTLKEIENIPVPVEKAKSFTSELRAAENEARRLAAAGQTNTEAYEKVTAEVARLKKVVGDVNATVKAINPGDKVAAFSALGNAIAGGAQAIGGAAIALGGNNQQLQEALFKFQSLLFAVQGAQTFLKDFKDSYENVKRVLGLTTVVQEASTVATAADVVMKEGQVVANTAAATSTNVLAVAIRGLGAALSSGPLLILAVVAAIALLAIAIISLGDETEDTTAKFDRLGESLDRAIRKNQVLRDIQKGQQDLDAERKAIEGQGTAEEKRAAIALKGVQDLQRAEQEQLEAKAKTMLVIAEIARNTAELEKAIREKDTEVVSELMTKRKELADELFDASLEQRKANAAVVEAEKANQNEISAFDKESKKEALDRARDLARQTLQIQETLAANIIAIEKEIQDKIAALEIEQADPRERLALERAAADEQIALLQRNLQRTIALERLRVQVGTEAFAELSEAQKQARADALIDAGGIELTIQQQEALNELRLATERKFGDELADVLREEAKTRFEILSTGQDRERQQFEFDLQDQIDRLRKAKVEEREVLAFEDRARADFARSQAQKAIELDAELQTAILEGRVRGAETEKEFERRKQLDLLAIKIEAAEASLKLIEGQGGKEAELQRAQIKATIATLTTEFQKLKSSPLNLNLLDLLGIAPEDQAQVKQAFASILDSTRSIIQSGIDARKQEVEQAIANTDAIIDDARRRRDELQAELDQALQDQRDGYANNADSIREQIELTKQAEEDALGQKKKQIEEQKRIARQQLAIDSALQVSALITANANLFVKGSLQGLPGIIAAVAAGLSLLATFASIRAKARAINSEPASSFKKGGKLKGARHDIDGLGGIALFDRRTGQHTAWAEDGEHITNREASQRHDPLLTAINSNDIGRVHQEAIRELTKAGRVVLDARELRRVTAPMTRTPGPDMHGLFKALIDRVDTLQATVDMFRRQEGGKPSTSKQGGKTVTSTPGHRVISK